MKPGWNITWFKLSDWKVESGCRRIRPDLGSINILHTLAACPSRWLLFNQAVGCHSDQQPATVINKPVLQLKAQTAGCRTSLDCLLHLFFRNVKSATSCQTEDSWKETLTESDDCQDDGDRYGHPGNPQRFLAVTLRLVRLQTHTALQKTCEQQQTEWCHDAYVGKVLCVLFQGCLDTLDFFGRKRTWTLTACRMASLRSASLPLLWVSITPS